MAWRIGVDIGGTFTDVVIAGPDGIHVGKGLSAPGDPSAGATPVISQLLESMNIDPAEVTHVVHGTTVTTNALITGAGDRVGLLTTKGIGQILHLARSWTPGPLAGWIIYEKPDPPADLRDTFEIGGRLLANGEEHEPLDEQSVRGAVAKLKDAGVRSVVISFLHSYRNPDHEQRALAIAREVAPEIDVTVASDVLAEFREYERTLVAVVNASLRPIVGDYLTRFRERLDEIGIKQSLSLLRSDGGMMTADFAERMPVHAIQSGPAGGVAGASLIAARAGHDSVLTFDMGGTSTDVALIEDGRPQLKRETEVGDFPLKVPAVDIVSIGAGGGSIAHVPELTGALRVGPQSAGADPGPACYGNGGEDPTVTDANLVLGRLPRSLLGGEFELDVDAARRAVERVAKPLNLGVEEAAQAILDVAIENMLGALRLISVQRGRDPARLALLAFGGAGPMHANQLASLAGCFPVIVPPNPGVLSAYGALASDFRNEFAAAIVERFDRLDLDAVRSETQGLVDQAEAWLDGEGIPAEERTVGLEADLRYYYQIHEVSVSFSLDELEPGLEQLTQRFGDLHEQLYGFRLDTELEFVNVRVKATGSVERPELEASFPTGTVEDAVTEEGEAVFDGRSVPIRHYDRTLLPANALVPGPAIISQLDTNIVVLPGHRARMDGAGNILIERDEPGASS